MKPNLLIILLLFTTPALTQSKTNKRMLGLMGERVNQDYKPDLIYDKQTGEKVDKKTYKKFRKKYSTVLESEYDAFGHEVKRYIDWSNPEKYHGLDVSKNIKVGDRLPEFKFIDINGDTIDSQSLLGKKVLIHFRSVLPFEQDFPYFLYKKIDNNVEATGVEVTKIFVFYKTKEKSLSKIDFDKLDYRIVPQSINAHRKFNLLNSMLTFIINEKGEVRLVFDGFNYEGIYQALTE